MKYLVVARHGIYNYRYQDNDHAHVTAEGQHSMEVLARRLARLSIGDSLQIFSSPVTCAFDSARIIAIEFKTIVSEDERLRVDVDYWPERIDHVVSLVETCRDDGVETLILVTHQEYAMHLIPRIEKRWFGEEMEPHEVDYSHCTVLECATGHILTLP